MFTNMDTDKSGTITFEELKTGLTRIGSRLTEAEVKQLMEAVSSRVYDSVLWHFSLKLLMTCVCAYIHTHYRLTWMEMERSTTLSSHLPQCTDTDSTETSSYTKYSSILTRMGVGKLNKIFESQDGRFTNSYVLGELRYKLRHCVTGLSRKTS